MGDLSLDYLAFEAEGQAAKVNIKDRELLRRFEEIDKLSEKDKGTIKEVLDTFILKNKFQTEDLLKSQNYQFEPLSLEILKTASEITDIPELHDRLIAATARYLDIPLITNDPVIRASKFVDTLE